MDLARSVEVDGVMVSVSEKSQRESEGRWRHEATLDVQQEADRRSASVALAQQNFAQHALIRASDLALHVILRKGLTLLVCGHESDGETVRVSTG